MDLLGIGWMGRVRFFRCWDILGLIRTWGLLSRLVGPGVGFLGLGLGLSTVMLESCHRKWQGANVSDFWGWQVFSATVRWSFDVLRTNGLGVGGGSAGLAMNRGVLRATVRWPFDGAQDERTGGLGWLGIVVGRGFRPLAALGVTEGGRGNNGGLG